MNEIKKLVIAVCAMLIGFMIVFAWSEYLADWPSWISDLVSNLSLALVAGIFSSSLVGLGLWCFDKSILDVIHKDAIRQGVNVVIRQSALFVSALSAWGLGRSRFDVRLEAQKILAGRGVSEDIDFCIQRVKSLKKVQVNEKNLKNLIRHVREYLDFLKTMFDVYGNVLIYRGYCGYLLSQHSELHKIVLTFENKVIPLKVDSEAQDEASDITKLSIIDQAFKIYLDKLEQFLKQAQGSSGT